MATLTICDVKVCGKVINQSDEQKFASIAGKSYVFCAKCHDDLMKFIAENLLSGQAVLPKLDLVPYIDKTNFGIPNWQWIPSNPPVTIPYINPNPWQNPWGIVYGSSTKIALVSDAINNEETGKKHSIASVTTDPKFIG